MIFFVSGWPIGLPVWPPSLSVCRSHTELAAAGQSMESYRQTHSNYRGFVCPGTSSNGNELLFIT